MEAKIGTTRVILISGDITEQETDAIVNAANPGLMGGGGVDGAIHSKGGPDILKECRIIRQTLWPDGLPTGEAVATTGGRLKAKKVIHTVGPIWSGGNKGEPDLLAQAYRSSLTLALRMGLRTISFPSISTGAYAYPIEKASRVAIKTVIGFTERNAGIEEVRFVLHSYNDLQVYEKALAEYMI
ncbi:putative phosphatase, C-terminal domain of histone macro H2A1 like protein [Candidatus Methanoperedens nitroreducens]|uniref:Putative phosphatase, C-terminal domain of histone macro H2A1 like protein n=1 Tax=Candidatus Methanoperedens nitratireducens TaxID=1392998 RepID=A0A062V954_9EURY|nr:O-acetyl-ADP-ribose deacetylase [Candidatus Methanoperedens nitroreducens]KCZ73063.1 putative phosphatase, C-terminal domain of histone macro H2A1 like protein [Candidatus Methanoperedens nitroreducens]MDJ1422991.1 O-acetyl-ADP-ribose deacetylase [Candidatus Methanoperedens sp.]